MEQLSYRNGVYRTQTQRVGLLGRMFPSLAFYTKFMWIVYLASLKSKRGTYDNSAWCHSSMGILRALERVRVQIEISGIEHLKGADGPCVVIGNHMSLLETVILPIIIQPVKDVTFVVKQSLLEYPVFKHVLRSRDPIALSRNNPREDFAAMMRGGKERLQNGISIIVFPQTTRTVRFEPKRFNSIGIKLAQREKVPVVPLAIKSDAWANGRRFKDFGRIDPAKRVHFAFGPSLIALGCGDDAHRQVIGFIEARLAQWQP